MTEATDGAPLTTPPVMLSVEASPTDHPCACTSSYSSDLSLLAYLLQDLRSLMRRADQGGVEIEPFDQQTWEVHGLARRTVVCDPEALCRDRDVEIVGFFGERRPSADESGIDGVELDIIDRFRHFPGIFAYSSIELVDDQWANLVVHERPEDREAWRRDPSHQRAVDVVSPLAYSSVRIHNGCLPGGVIGPHPIRLRSTKYWDFDTDPVWHAVRLLPEGLRERVDAAAGPGAERRAV